MQIGQDLRPIEDPQLGTVLVGGNLVSWKSKKQSVVAPSSSEADYSVMARGTCELLWLKTLMRELGFVCKKPMLTMLDIFPPFLSIMREDKTY